jgi:hypothetical protein
VADKRARKRVHLEAVGWPIDDPINDARWDDMWLITEEDTDSAEDFSDEYI